MATRNSSTEYSSSIKQLPYLFIEMRKAARMLASGEAPETIKRMSVEDNLFQLDKEQRRRELASRITMRLAALSDDQVSLLANGTDEDAKLVALYAMLKTDLLFFEFMRDVFMDRSDIGQTRVTDCDIEIFLAAKAQESAKVASWTARTLIDMKSTYKIILCQAGLAKRDNGALALTRPVITRETASLWDPGDIYAKAMLLEV